MRNTRALIASVGAGISLVAATALMLLTFSAVVALEGWPGVDRVRDQPALVVGDDVFATIGDATTARIDPVVLRRPTSQRPHERPAATPRPATTAVRTPASRHRQARPVARPAPKLELTRPKPPPERSEPAPEPRPQPAPPLRVPKTGDTVREVGDGLSGTVQSTGELLKDLTAPVSPATGKVLRDLTNFVAGVLQQTTGLLAGALDKALPGARP